MATKVIRNSKSLGDLFSTLTIPRFLGQRTKLTNFCKSGNINNFNINNACKFSVNSVVFGSAGHAETTSTTQGLSKLQAQELILRLNGEERSILMTALHEYQSKLIKDEYEGCFNRFKSIDLSQKLVERGLVKGLHVGLDENTGQLAASRWRSKFGRPSKLPRLGDVDPTGSYCPFPEDWLQKKMAEAVPRPTTKNLVDIAIANSIPFIGFGFLDNFFMLIFGDYIDLYLGSYFCLTTMGAAALGNTLSDILGIGTAFYVERLANRIGFRPPKLSPIQLDMSCSRNSANFGRVMGVTLGCLLGMCPLFFKKGKEETEPEVDAVQENVE